MKTTTKARAVSGTIAALAGTAALLLLSGCQDGQQLTEVEVKLKNGETASCIVVEDETGAVEDLDCLEDQK